MLSDGMKRKFYNGKKWREKAKKIQLRDRGICTLCGKLIVGRHIVDHIVELDIFNVQEEHIAYGEDNLQLLCISCHNKKTFRGQPLLKNGVVDFANRKELLKNCQVKR